MLRGDLNKCYFLNRVGLYEVDEF